MQTETPSPVDNPSQDAAPRKTFRGGTHRSVSPDETLRRFLPIARRLGVTRLADLTGLDRIGLPVVSAVRPASRSLAVSQGKGLSLDAAKASAMMESVELWHGEHIELPLRFASWSELEAGGGPVLDPSAMAGSARAGSAMTGPAFDPRRRILWLTGEDLLSGEEVLLPLETVQTDCVLGDLPGAGSFSVDSNGLASGNHLTEATVHALCELIERDTYTRRHGLGEAAWDAGRLDLETVDDALCLQALALFRAADVKARVWELDSESEVPVFLCEIADRPGSSWPCPGRFAGLGCHLDAGIALLRCLTEAAQSRLTAISGARDDLFRRPMFLRAWKTAGGLVEPDRSRTTARAFRPRHAFETFDEDLEDLLRRLRSTGHERVVRVDLTRPELGIPVVRLVVPGLRFDARLL